MSKPAKQRLGFKPVNNFIQMKQGHYFLKESRDTVLGKNRVCVRGWMGTKKEEFQAMSVGCGL